MSYSYTTTETKTFTITHAKHIASKVATDLKRIQRFYKSPSDLSINDFENEVIELLKHGYLKKVSYGFQKDEKWIEPTLIYEASELNIVANDDPGKVRPGKDITGASFCSYLEYSNAWYLLSDEEKELFKHGLSIQRTTGSVPNISGYLNNDRTYSSGGRALSRSSVRSYL